MRLYCYAKYTNVYCNCRVGSYSYARLLVVTMASTDFMMVLFEGGGVECRIALFLSYVYCRLRVMSMRQQAILRILLHILRRGGTEFFLFSGHLEVKFLMAMLLSLELIKLNTSLKLLPTISSWMNQTLFL